MLCHFEVRASEPYVSLREVLGREEKRSNELKIWATLAEQKAGRASPDLEVKVLREL